MGRKYADSLVDSAAEEVAALRRELVEREAQISEMQAQLLSAQAQDLRRSTLLKKPTDDLEKRLAEMDRLDDLVWRDDPRPPYFDAKGTRERVLRLTAAYTLEQRLAWLDMITFVPTPQVDRLNQRIDLLIQAKPGVNANLRVSGEQGTGKTLSLRRKAMRTNALAARGEKPILFLEAPVVGQGLTQLFREALAELDAPTRGDSANVEVRFYLAALEKKVRVIIIDEGRNINTTAKCNHLLRLSNKLLIPIVVANAEPDWADHHLHLKRRFLPLHQFGAYRGAEIGKLLFAMEVYLPFVRRSNLDADDVVQPDGSVLRGKRTLIEEWTEGSMHRVADLVYESARIALARQHPCILMEDLEAGWKHYRFMRGQD